MGAERDKARTQMLSILGPDIASVLSGDDVERALDEAKMVDLLGKLPADPLWQETYDVYWAAAEVATILGMRQAANGGIKEYSADGSRFVVTQQDYMTLAKFLRGKSSLGSALTPTDGMHMVQVGLGLNYGTTAKGWIDNAI